MSARPNRDKPDNVNPFAGPTSWVQRRRQRIIDEIQANRRGEYRVPTWVLVIALVAMIAAVCAVLIFA